MNQTIQHFRVRSVFRNGQQTTLTLDPVDWWRETGEMITDPNEIGDGHPYPDIEECDPSADGAYPDLTHAKTTELRFDGDLDSVDPDDLLTLAISATETSWVPPTEDEGEG